MRVQVYRVVCDICQGCLRTLFDIDLWNVYDCVENDLPCTNNSIEGWDHAFDQRVGVTHSTILTKFGLKRQQLFGLYRCYCT